MPRWAARFLSQPGGIAFQILDAKIRKMNLYTPNYDQATTAKADTLEKLAEELDLDVAKFVKTVTEFNAAVQPGKYNPDRHHLDGKCTAGIYPPKSNYALEIDEPPFEAFPVRCGMTFHLWRFEDRPEDRPGAARGGAAHWRPVCRGRDGGWIVGRQLCFGLGHDGRGDVRADCGHACGHRRVETLNREGREAVRKGTRLMITEFT